MSKLATLKPSVTARTRRTVAGLAASAAVLIAFAAARGPGGLSPSKAARPDRRPDVSGRVTREATNVLPDVAARTFVSSYVSFLYGRRAAAGVAPIGHGLYRQLLGAQSTATPAELTRSLVVRDLTVSPNATATAIGSAVVDDGASPPYALSFNLTFSHRRWLVTAVRRSGR